MLLSGIASGREPFNPDLCYDENYYREHKRECDLYVGRPNRYKKQARSEREANRSRESGQVSRGSEEGEGRGGGQKRVETPFNPDLCYNEDYYREHKALCDYYIVKEDESLKRLRKLETLVTIPPPSTLARYVPGDVLESIKGWKTTVLEDLRRKYEELKSRIESIYKSKMSEIESWYKNQLERENKAYNELKSKLDEEYARKRDEITKLYNEWKSEDKKYVEVDTDNDGKYDKKMTLDEWYQWILSYLENQYESKLSELESKHSSNLESIKKQYEESKKAIEEWREKELEGLREWYEKNKKYVERLSELQARLASLLRYAEETGEWSPREFEAAARKAARELGLNPDEDEAVRKLISDYSSKYSSYYYSHVVPKKTREKIEELRGYAEQLRAEYEEKLRTIDLGDKSKVKALLDMFKQELMEKARALGLGDNVAAPVIDEEVNKLVSIVNGKITDINKRVEMEVKTINEILRTVAANIVFDPSWSDRAKESLERELAAFKRFLDKECPGCRSVYTNMKRLVEDVKKKLDKVKKTIEGLDNLASSIAYKIAFSYVFGGTTSGAAKGALSGVEGSAIWKYSKQIVNINKEAASVAERLLKAAISGKSLDADELLSDPKIAELLKPIDDYVKRNAVEGVPLNWDSVAKYYKVKALNEVVSKIQEMLRNASKGIAVVCYRRDSKTNCDIYDSSTGRYEKTLVFSGVSPKDALNWVMSHSLLEKTRVDFGYAAERPIDAGLAIYGYLRSKGLSKEADEAICNYVGGLTDKEFWEYGQLCTRGLAKELAEKALKLKQEATSSSNEWEKVKKGLEAALYALGASATAMAAGVASGVIGTAEMIVNPKAAYEGMKQMVKHGGEIVKTVTNVKNPYSVLETTYLAGNLIGGIALGLGAEGAASSLARSGAGVARTLGKAGQALIKASAAAAGAGIVHGAYETGGLKLAAPVALGMASLALLRPERIGSIEESGYKGYRLKLRNPLTGKERTIAYLIKKFESEGRGEGLGWNMLRTPLEGEKGGTTSLALSQNLKTGEPSSASGSTGPRSFLETSQPRVGNELRTPYGRASGGGYEWLQGTSVKRPGSAGGGGWRSLTSLPKQVVEKLRRMMSDITVGVGSPAKEEAFVEMKFAKPGKKANVEAIYKSSADVRDISNALKRRGYEEEAELVTKVYEAAKRAAKNYEKLDFKNLNVEFDVGGDLGKEVGRAVKEFLQVYSGEVDAVYGSMAYRSHLGEWWRKVQDVDVMLKTENPEEAERFAKELADYINKRVGKKVAYAEGTKVYLKTSEGPVKIVDVHYQGEELPYEVKTWGGGAGQVMGEKITPRKVEGLNVYGAEHGALVKGASSVSPYKGAIEEILNTYKEYVEQGLVNKEFLEYLKKLGETKGGEILYTGPAPWRTKDVADFLYLVYQAAVKKKDSKLMRLAYELEEAFKKRGLLPKDFSLRDYKPTEISLQAKNLVAALVRNKETTSGDIVEIVESLVRSSPSLATGSSLGLQSPYAGVKVGISLPSFSASGSSSSSPVSLSTVDVTTSTTTSTETKGGGESPGSSSPNVDISTPSYQPSSPDTSSPESPKLNLDYSISTPSSRSAGGSSGSDDSNDSSGSNDSGGSDGSGSGSGGGGGYGPRMNVPLVPIPRTGVFRTMSGLGGRRTREVLLLL